MEQDARGSHTVYESQAKEASITADEQEGDTDVETALAALAGESDIDLEETDVQEILLASEESRQLRGEQWVNRGHRPVTGRTSGGKPYRDEGRLDIKELITCTCCSICRERTLCTRMPKKENRCPEMVKKEVKTSFFVYFGGDHSTPGYLGTGVIDTGCSRFLIGQRTLEKWKRMLTSRWGLSTQRVQLGKARTFRFGNVETLETWTLAILPVGIAGVNGVVLRGAPLLLSKEFLRNLGCHIDLGRGHLFFEKLGVRSVVTSEQSPHLLLPLTSFGHKDTRSQLKSSHARATCDSSRQNNVHSWIASASDHRTQETDNTDTESLHGTDGQEKNPCDEA